MDKVALGAIKKTNERMKNELEEEKKKKEFPSEMFEAIAIGALRRQNRKMKAEYDN